MTPEPEPRAPEFGRFLSELMDNERIRTRVLASTMGVSTMSIGRYRKGHPPNRTNFDRLIAALRQLMKLGDEDEARLQALGGYDPPIESVLETVARTSTCRIYSYRYAETQPPGMWSARLAEAEAKYGGDLDEALDYVPSPTRPEGIYVERYTPASVASQVQRFSGRMAAFEERLAQSNVRHLYLRRGVEAYFKGRTRDWRFEGVSDDIRREQARTVVRWLETYETFHVALTELELQANFEIINSSVVFLELPQHTAPLGRANIMGLELVGSRAVVEFQRYFSGIWLHKKTTRGRDRALAFFRQFA